VAKNSASKTPEATEIKSSMEPKVVAMSIAIEVPHGSAGTYVNYIEVVHTPYDFTLVGIQIPAKLGRDHMNLVSEGRQVTFEAEIQLTFPTSILVGLINALLIQKDQYEKIHNVNLGSVNFATSQQVKT
jgi:hypothetical protein